MFDKLKSLPIHHLTLAAAVLLFAVVFLAEWLAVVVLTTAVLLFLAEKLFPGVLAQGWQKLK